MPTIKLLRSQTNHKKKKYNPNSENRKQRQKIYQTTEWRKLRLAHLMNFPLCQRCSEHGVDTAAKDLHHLISFMKGKDEDERKSLAFNDNNIISVCQHCHLYLHHEKESQFEDGDKYDVFKE